MKIAVTESEGEIFQHFGHCQSFLIYDIKDNKIENKEILKSEDGGHSALSSMLKRAGVNVLICGGIGGGAITALEDYGIEVFGGAVGKCDDAVNDYLKGQLKYDPFVKCSHHDAHHKEGEGCHGPEGCKGGCHK